MLRQYSIRSKIIIISILALAISGYLGITYFGFGVSSSGLIQNKLNQHMDLNYIYYVTLYLHIATGIIALSIGWIQFIPNIRKKNLNLHRTIGKIYSICVFFSSLFGIFIAFKATGGWISTVAFLMLAVFWGFTLIKGYRAVVVNKDQRNHQKWMIRNYALTFAAVTLRIYLPVSMLFFGFEHFDTYYRVIAWLCWVPNLLFAEWIWINKIETGRKMR